MARIEWKPAGKGFRSADGRYLIVGGFKGTYPVAICRRETPAGLMTHWTKAKGFGAAKMICELREQAREYSREWQHECPKNGCRVTLIGPVCRWCGEQKKLPKSKDFSLTP